MLETMKLHDHQESPKPCRDLDDGVTLKNRQQISGRVSGVSKVGELGILCSKYNLCMLHLYMRD